MHELTLAKQFGVSRAPIRDALLQLTQERLLVARPNCGVMVGAALRALPDNGGTAGVKLFNAGLRGSKTSAYDGGHRAACFLHWPDGNLTHRYVTGILAVHRHGHPRRFLLANRRGLGIGS